jgi:hypothetical protein
MVAIFAVIVAAQRFPSNRFFLPMTQAAVATFIFLLLHILMLRVMGFEVGLDSAVVLLPLVLLHSVLILPVYWLLNSLINIVRPRRVQL